jgi:hypothetical protein
MLPLLVVKTSHLIHYLLSFSNTCYPVPLTQIRNPPFFPLWIEKTRDILRKVKEAGKKVIKSELIHCDNRKQGLIFLFFYDIRKMHGELNQP